MNQTRIQDPSGQEWLRVSKTVARKIYNAGEQVTACPCKLYPFGSWATSVTRAGGSDFADFDFFCSRVTWHNCCKEVGSYLAYYVKSK